MQEIQTPAAAKIAAGQQKNSGPVTYTFPPKITDASTYCVIKEFQPKLSNGEVINQAWSALQGNTRLGPRISENLQGTYYFPMPLQGLQDDYTVQYNENFAGYLPQLFPSRARAATGAYQNTFKSITLDAPDFRNFKLTWKFSPQNQSETETLNQIVYRIRTNITPDTSDGKMFFTFPFAYWVGFKNAKYMYRMKPAVIRNIAIDYTGGQQVPSFYQGTVAPESLVISLTFLELEYWIKTDYKGISDASHDNRTLNWYNP